MLIFKIRVFFFQLLNFTLLIYFINSEDGYMGKDGERGFPGEPGQKGECIK